MTWGRHLKPLIDLECKLLDNCPPINIPAIVYVEKKKNKQQSTFWNST